MSRFFNFYDPLEKRYVFNSFLVVVGLVEILILVFTLVWQIDVESIFSEEVRRGVPFPWKDYLLAAFVAPLVLLFLFGVIVQGFEMIFGKEPGPSQQKTGFLPRMGRARYLLGLLVFLAGLALLFWSKPALSLLAAAIKALGLGGAYLLIAVLALAFLYLPLRLLLRYRLQKKAMEYQYLLAMAQRHGLILVDPKRHPGLAPDSPPLAGSAPEALPPADPDQD